jgi:cytoskeleton-associated protein 5
VPTRKVRGTQKGGASGVADDEEDEEAPAPLNVDDLLPRTDISGSITPALLGMIGSSNWKERNAGVDQVRWSWICRVITLHHGQQCGATALSSPC